MSKSEVLQGFNKDLKNPILDFLPFRCHLPILGNSYKDREVGIEIEMEGTNLPAFPLETTGATWTVHADNSLRNGGLEYTLSNPISKDSVPKALYDLYGYFSKHKAQLYPGQRCSTHVHINAQGMKMNELVSFMCLWYIIEDVMINWCGDRRRGNLFCLSLKDANGLIDRIVRSITRDGSIQVGEEVRYASLNLHAFRKFGSFEFRSLRAVTEPDIIINWTNALIRLKELAMGEYRNPMKIVGDFSAMDGIQFLENLFKGLPILPELFSEASKSELDISKSCWDSIRLIHPILYSFPWDGLMDEIYKERITDPFGKEEKPRKFSGRLRENVIVDDIPEPGLHPVPQPAPGVAGDIQNLIDQMHRAEMARIRAENERRHRVAARLDRDPGF